MMEGMKRIMSKTIIVAVATAPAVATASLNMAQVASAVGPVLSARAAIIVVKERGRALVLRTGCGAK